MTILVKQIWLWPEHCAMIVHAIYLLTVLHFYMAQFWPMRTSILAVSLIKQALFQVGMVNEPTNSLFCG